MSLIKEIFSYKAMVGSLVKRDLRGRYKGSFLGFFWTFLNPLLQLLVYTLVFSVIIRMGYEKYYLFLFVALVPWLFFSNSIVAGAGCIWTQKDLVNKIYFPREVLPLSHVTSQLVNMLLSMIVVIAVILVTGYGVNIKAILFMPIVILVEYFLALGITLLVSSVTVFMRDIEYILSIFIIAWQFLTPVMYGIDMVPEKYQFIFHMNPMTSIIVAYRDILYYKKIPQVSTLLTAFLLGMFFMFVGLAVFEKLKKHFSEEL